MLRDKNGQYLKEGDYICICDKYLVQIHEFPSVGMGFNVKDICGVCPTIDPGCLKANHRNIGNTQGQIPLSFLDLTKIEKCTKKERLELCI